MTHPIITSLLDTDYYKFTMQQAVFHHYPTAVVDARFHCRTDIDLRPLMHEVKEQIDTLADLRLAEDEKQWLGEGGIFKADYLDWLAGHRLDPSNVNVEATDSGLQIEVHGSWLEVTLFEIYILSIISELYGRSLQTGADPSIGRQRLTNKINWLRRYVDPQEGFHFVDFGTRRRFSSAWQRELVETLQREIPDYISGTSNMWLARELNLPVVGTMGHEWLQAHQALTSDLGASQRKALEVWLEEYNGALGIALTDTISMSAFLNDFKGELVQRFTGMRHDSGDPMWWGERAIAHYHQQGIDPMTRTLVFSDGLDFARAWEISHRFSGQINTSFGIGTWLTNDVGGRPLNMVLKLTTCNGQPVAKISDTPGKTMCLDQAYIDNLKRIYKVA